MSAEKLGYWLCAAILGGIASFLSLGLFFNFLEGRVLEFSKYGGKKEYLLSQDILGFCIATIPYFLMAGTFWYFAFWVWKNRIRG